MFSRTLAGFALVFAVAQSTKPLQSSEQTYASSQNANGADTQPGQAVMTYGASAQYDQASQGDGQAGNYQQHMKQYAGGGKSDSPGGSQAGSQGGEYQKHMKQHAGGTQSGVPGGSQAGGQGGDYQKYMNQSAGGYRQYMKQGGRSSPGSQGSGQAGNYQQYTQLYAGDYQQYMKQRNQDTKKMTQGEALRLHSEDYVPQLENASDSQRWAAAYASQWQPRHRNMTQSDALGQYESAYVPHVRNSNDTHEWANAYMQGYAGASSRSWDDEDERSGDATPKSAEGCHTLAELNMWRAAQLKWLRAFVPKDLRVSAENALEAKFRSEKARIEEESAQNLTEDARIKKTVEKHALSRKAEFSEKPSVNFKETAVEKKDLFTHDDHAGAELLAQPTPALAGGNTHPLLLVVAAAAPMTMALGIVIRRRRPVQPEQYILLDP